MDVDFKTPGLNNPEYYVLTHNRFNTYMVLIFTDLKKPQIYKIPYRNSHHQQIEIVTKFDYQHVFGPDENNKVGNFLFEIENKNNVHVGENFFKFETNDEVVKYSSEHGHNDVKYPFAYDKENIYFMLDRKYLSIQEYENSTMKNGYQYLYKKDDELKGDNIAAKDEGIVEYGSDFSNCKILHSKQKNLQKIVVIFKLIAMIINILIEQHFSRAFVG